MNELSQKLIESEIRHQQMMEEVNEVNRQLTESNQNLEQEMKSYTDNLQNICRLLEISHAQYEGERRDH